MKSKYLFSVIAIAIAFTLSAFTAPQKPDQSLTSFPVWFEVDVSGNPLNSSNGQTGSNPFSCPDTNQRLCARSLTYDSNPGDTEVILNEDETTYSIAEGVDITSSAYYDGEHTKNTP